MEKAPRIQGASGIAVDDDPGLQDSAVRFRRLPFAIFHFIAIKKDASNGKVFPMVAPLLPGKMGPFFAEAFVGFQCLELDIAELRCDQCPKRLSRYRRQSGHG